MRKYFFPAWLIGLLSVSICYAVPGKTGWYNLDVPECNTPGLEINCRDFPNYYLHSDCRFKSKNGFSAKNGCTHWLNNSKPTLPWHIENATLSKDFRYQIQIRQDHWAKWNPFADRLEWNPFQRWLGWNPFETTAIDFLSDIVPLSEGKTTDFKYTVGQNGGKYLAGKVGQALGRWGQTTTYNWRVRGCDDTGCGDWYESDDIAFQMPAYFSTAKWSHNYLLVGAVTKNTAEIIANTPFEIDARILFGILAEIIPQNNEYSGRGRTVAERNWEMVSGSEEPTVWRIPVKSPLPGGWLKEQADEQIHFYSRSAKPMDRDFSGKTRSFDINRIGNQFYLLVSMATGENPNNSSWRLYQGGSVLPNNRKRHGVLRFKLSGLRSNTSYAYALQFKASSDKGPYLTSSLKSFSTAKNEGKPFKMVITADLHRPLHVELFGKWALESMAYLKAENPDFIVDLGDLADVDVFNPSYNQEQVDSIYYQNIAYYQALGFPTVFVPGNHEAINQYYDKQSDAFRGWHYAPWLSSKPLLSGVARLKYMPHYQHGIVGLSPDYRTFFSWEWGDALFIVFDPFTYTTVYPTNCVSNSAFTLGIEQKKWLRDVVKNTDRKYIVLFGHHTLSGIFNNEILCYGKGGAEVAGRGNNPTELFDPLPTGRTRTVMFLGHDHVFVAENYRGLEMVHCPSLTKSRIDNWSWDKQGYGKAEWMFDGCFVGSVGDGKDTIWRGKILSIRESRDRYIINYQGDVHEQFIANPANPAVSNQYKHVRNYTRKATATVLSIDTEQNTIDISKVEDISDSPHGWKPNDELMFVCGKPGYVVVEISPENLVYYMKDKNGNEVKGTRRSLTPIDKH